MLPWIVNLLIIGSASILFFRTFRDGLPTWTYWVGLSLKLSGGIVLGLIFSRYYSSGDTFAFFDLATQLLALNENNPLAILDQDPDLLYMERQPRVFFFIQLLAVIVWISGGSYWIASLYLSLLSFFGFCFVLRELNSLFPSLKWLHLIAFLMVPSAVIWSSGILKESVANPSFAILIVIVLKIYKGKRLLIIDLVLTLVSLLLILYLKHYLLIALLVFSGLLFSLLLYRKLTGIKRWIAALLVLATGIGLSQMIHPYLTLERLAQTLFENNQAIAHRTQDLVGIEIEAPTWDAVLRETPKALFTGLFRPTLFDKTPLLGAMVKFENFLFLVMTCLTILLLVRHKHEVDWKLIFSAVMGIFLLATMLALSTPNFGSLTRYKSAFLPFALVLVSAIPFPFLIRMRKIE